MPGNLTGLLVKGLLHHLQLKKTCLEKTTLLGRKMASEHLKYLDLWCNVLQGDWASNSSLAMKSPITLLSIQISNSSRLTDCDKKKIPTSHKHQQKPGNPILVHCFLPVRGSSCIYTLPVSESQLPLLFPANLLFSGWGHGSPYNRATGRPRDPHTFGLCFSEPEKRQALSFGTESHHLG